MLKTQNSTILEDLRSFDCLLLYVLFFQQLVLKRERFVETRLLAPMGHAAKVCNVLAIATDLEVRLFKKSSKMVNWSQNKNI